MMTMTTETVKALSAKKAWTPEALLACGVPQDQVMKMIADGKHARPERAFVAVGGRKRTHPTTLYIWGPDIRFHLGLDGKAGK